MTTTHPVVGRNEPCPCGSALRYKHCHGSLQMSESEDAADLLRMHQLLETRRKRQQGLGRAICSFEFRGYRFVAVSNGLRRGTWKTFTDFLLDYIKITLSPDWGTSELRKPIEQRHPVLVWYVLVCEAMTKNRDPNGGPYELPLTGVVQAYLGLAYDLYILDRNQDQTDDPDIRRLLLKRLQHPNEFAGARHEIRVAAQFLRAGFHLAWRGKLTTKTSEFVATFPQTGKRFDVECKMRQSSDPTMNVRRGIGKLVNAALEKVTNLPRMIFLEVNAPLDPLPSNWKEWVVKKVRDVEKKPPRSAMPPAYIFITNFPYHHHLDAPGLAGELVLEGYNIPDIKSDGWATLDTAIESRNRHLEAHKLLDSIAEHRDIPSSFDGAVLGLESGTSWTVGQVYELGDGRTGLLESATVLESTSQACLLMRLSNGDAQMHMVPLSAWQMEAWKRHQDTFFCAVEPERRGVKSILQLYDFILNSLSDVPLEQLLGRVSPQSDQAVLQRLSRDELADMIARRMTETVAERAGMPSKDMSR